MMSEINKCPFCGNSDKRVGIRRQGNKGYRVICGKCGASGPYVAIKDWHGNKMIAQGQAIKGWNTRKPMERIVEQLEREKETYKRLYGLHREGCYLGMSRGLDMAIEALEKQVPKKPRIVSEIPKTHNLGRLLQFHCPRCGKFIVGTYETDPERGGGIHERLKGCSTCLQAIDFSGYYHKGQLDEDIEWSDTDD